MNLIKKNLEKIKKEVGSNVLVVAVSKTKPLDCIKKAYETGHRDFGENKIQEMTSKFNDLPKILKWIKEPSHSEHLFIIEQTLKSVKADQFKVGTKVSFGRENGQKRMGIIEKFGRVKAVVNCNGAKWRVPFDLMSVVTE